MKLRYPLYLASQSTCRSQLLRAAHIPFTSVQHASDENFPYHGHTLAAYVTQVSQHKMSHVVLPPCTIPAEETLDFDSPANHCLVLVADTLVAFVAPDHTINELFSKPKDREDAERMLRLLRAGPALVTTVCILELRMWQAGTWHTRISKTIVVESQVHFDVPDSSFDEYFEYIPHALYACGGAVIEGFGNLFLRSISGSYTAVMGLPLAEVYDALVEMGAVVHELNI